MKEEEIESECRKRVVSTKEIEGKTKEIECLIESHEGFKEKQDEIESEGTKEELSSLLLEGYKRKEMSESFCDSS